MPNAKENSYVLGLDLGVSSVGWALLEPSKQRFVAAGVRIFDSGMDESKFAKGEQGASNNVERRLARLHRRQLRRRAARQRDLFVTLQQAGLLPGDPHGGNAEIRHKILEDLDRRLALKWRGRVAADNPAVIAPEHVLPYFLRARALDHRLEPEELGRALYHLGQRRGYKSNRREGKRVQASQETAAKKAAADKDDRKVVLADIAGLERDMAASGARTLGEFLSRVDPSAARIRTRHTSRKMFEEEFALIWSAQQKHNPAIFTHALRQKLWNLLFFQRPISAGKPGFCELEENCTRAPMYTPAAQRFRLLQKVNDLRIIADSGAELRLSPQQRDKLLAALEAEGDLTFPKVRAALDLPKKVRFNLQANDDKLPGNRTNSALLRLFADRWLALSHLEKLRIARDWADTRRSDEDLVHLATEHWSLDRTSVEQWLQDPHNHPEDGYSKLSLRALSKLLPLMESGTSFKTAETEIYGNRFSGKEEKDHLPPVEDVLPQIPNPAVMRALTEMRKVVNAILREHGKPGQVRVELARDLKRSAKDRHRLTDRMWDNRKRREKVIARIQKEAGIPNPSGRDRDKGLLFDELQECAYCGSPISFSNLFSDSPQFDIDHILPISRFPDNSLSNKTLACRVCNAQKLNRTPFEAFGSDPQLWEKLIVRLSSKRPTGFGISEDKRKRLLLGSPEALKLWPDDAHDVTAFSARHLADTRYITKLAARYLEELYGGRDRQLPWEDQKQRKVFASSGMVTATLRGAWLMEKLVARCPACREKNQKCRCDHRHHAIDAMVIALSNQAAVQQLSAAAAVGDGRIAERVSSRTLQQPWTDFIASLQPLVDNLLVSHRPQHKLAGPLHDETIYGRPRPHGGKDYIHVRKPVHVLSLKDIKSDYVIVDPRIRGLVQTKVSQLGGDQTKLEHDPPVLVTRKGKHVPIRKVRIRDVKSVTRVAVSPRDRYVATNENHHVAILAELDRSGEEKRWDGELVTRLEAMRSKQREQPSLKKSYGIRPEVSFKFTLMGRDIVELNDPTSPTGRSLFIVRTISEDKRGYVKVELSGSRDARLKKDIQGSGGWISKSPNELRKLKCRKVIIDALGQVRNAND